MAKYRVVKDNRFSYVYDIQKLWLGLVWVYTFNYVSAGSKEEAIEEVKKTYSSSKPSEAFELKRENNENN